MNYKLINKSTNEEAICTKVVVNGFDYYINDELPDDQNGYWTYIGYSEPIIINKCNQPIGWFRNLHDKNNYKKVIATNNPNIDLPQVIDEVEELAKKSWGVLSGGLNLGKSEKLYWVGGFQHGYNKSQETHSYSKEDMLNLIQSLKDYTHESHSILGQDEREPIEFLEIWESKQIKTLYYE